MVGSKDTIRISFASRIDFVCGRSRSTIHEKGLKWDQKIDHYKAIVIEEYKDFIQVAIN